MTKTRGRVCEEGEVSERYFSDGSGECFRQGKFGFLIRTTSMQLTCYDRGKLERISCLVVRRKFQGIPCK